MRSTARLAFLALAVACLVAALPSAALPPEETSVEIGEAPRTPLGPHNVVGSDPEACIKPGTVTLSRSPSSVAVGGTVTLTWNDQVIDSYIPVWSLSSSGPWYYLLNPPYTTAATQMTVTISDSSLAGKTIYFFVRALGSCDLYTDSNVVSVTVTGGGSGCVGPPTPSLSINKTSVAAGGSFTLTWSADPYGTTDYWWVGVGTAASGTYSQVATYSRTTLSATLSTAAADAGKTLYYRVWAYPYGGSTCESLKTYSNAVSISVTSGGGGGTCTTDANTLCLYNNRFRVQATYRDYQNTTGTAKAVSLTSDSGYFWFFTQANVELVAKIVSFCSGSSGNYGLYISGLTDVNVTFTVTDTKTGIPRTYTNPLGNRYCTIGDAWNACP